MKNRGIGEATYFCLPLSFPSDVSSDPNSSSMIPLYELLDGTRGREPIHTGDVRDMGSTPGSKDIKKPYCSLNSFSTWELFFTNYQLFVILFAHVNIEKCILKVKITFNVDIFILRSQ